MNKPNSGTPESRPTTGQASRWLWVLGGGLLVIILALLLPRRPSAPVFETVFGGAQKSDAAAGARAAAGRAGGPSPRSGLVSTPAASAEEIVSGKVIQFARGRREILHRMAKRFKIEVPVECEQFFDLAEAGKWDELKAAYDSLRKKWQNGGVSQDIHQLWGPINETLGVAEAAHEWPAQKLLDYGNAILGSLRPGMVYVGGTDPGRFIPTLLNETSDGERHIVLTQNALADSTYLEYLSFLYQDRLATLTSDDSQRAFQDYIADAQKRALHDQQSADDSKQLRPGEDVRLTEGRVQVSGEVAVMNINELLLQTLMKNNPEASFALEESFPLKSTYGDATLLGPIMELRAPDGPKALTQEQAAQSVNYWRNMAQQLGPDADAPDGSLIRKTYSKMAAAQANLLADHNYSAEAEQAYRLANQLEPSSPEPVTGLSELLARTGRGQEARQVLDDFARSHPDQRASMDATSAWLKLR
jgi:hypothetical protein